MTDPLAAIQRRQQRDVTLLYSTLSDVVEGAFDRHTTPGQVVTQEQRRRIMADVDRSLDILWGNRPGADCAIKTIVLRDTTSARFAPLDDAVRRWKREMGPELRERVEQEAQS